MPILITTPDMSAETCVGALAWAGGSQTWSGMTPAFVPNPSTARRKSAVVVPLPAVESARGVHEKHLGEEDRRKRVHPKRKRAPGHRPVTLERRGSTGKQTREGAREAQKAA